MSNNNNNNNNKHDNVYGAVIMAEPLREFTRFILMNAEWRQAAADPRPSHRGGATVLKVGETF